MLRRWPSHCCMACQPRDVSQHSLVPRDWHTDHEPCCRRTATRMVMPGATHTVCGNAHPHTHRTPPHGNGDGAIIAARAVVSGDVPDYAIVAGNPARIIRRKPAAGPGAVGVRVVVESLTPSVEHRQHALLRAESPRVPP